MSINKVCTNRAIGGMSRTSEQRLKSFRVLNERMSHACPNKSYIRLNEAKQATKSA